MGPVQASVCNHVKISQQMSVAALDSSFFISFAGALGDSLQRGMLALPNYTHSPKPGWMEVRLSANQNVSLMVFGDEVYSDTPLITAALGCALQAYSSRRLVIVHLQSTLAP